MSGVEGRLIERDTLEKRQLTNPKRSTLKGADYFLSDITKTYQYNFDTLKPHFYIVKLDFTGVNLIFLISAQKHRLWVRVRGGSNGYTQPIF